MLSVRKTRNGNDYDEYELHTHHTVVTLTMQLN